MSSFLQGLEDLFHMDRKLSGRFRIIKVVSYLPSIGETLYIYLATSEETVVVVLVKVEDAHQFPVYYVNKVLQNDKLRYTKIKKNVYALVIVTRKLQPYFQAHLVVVVAN